MPGRRKGGGEVGGLVTAFSPSLRRLSLRGLWAPPSRVFFQSSFPRRGPRRSRSPSACPRAVEFLLRCPARQPAALFPAPALRPTASPPPEECEDSWRPVSGTAWWAAAPEPAAGQALQRENRTGSSRRPWPGRGRAMAATGPRPSARPGVGGGPPRFHRQSRAAQARHVRPLPPNRRRRHLSGSDSNGRRARRVRLLVSVETGRPGRLHGAAARRPRALPRHPAGECPTGLECPVPAFVPCVASCRPGAASVPDGDL